MNTTKEKKVTKRVTKNLAIKDARLDVCPWMLRDQHQAIRDAVQVKNLMCTNVKFVKTSTEEVAMGCHVAAECEEVEILEKAPTFEPKEWTQIAYYCGSMVLANAYSKIIHECSKLLLTENKELFIQR